MHSVVRNGSTQATTSKAASQKLPSKAPIANRPPIKSVSDQSLRANHSASKQLLSQNGRPQSSQSQRMQSTSHGQRPHQPVQSQWPLQSLQGRRPQQSPQNTRPQLMSKSQRPQQSLQRQRPQLSSQNERLESSERQRPPSQSYRPQSSQGQRPSSVQGRQYSEQRRIQANDRVKSAERQIRPPSKPMVILLRSKFVSFSFVVMFHMHLGNYLGSYVSLKLISSLSCSCSHHDKYLPTECVMPMQRKSNRWNEDLMILAKMRKIRWQWSGACLGMSVYEFLVCGPFCTSWASLIYFVG